MYLLKKKIHFVSFIYIVAFFLAIPVSAGATSASISVSGNEGWITVTATASFSSYEVCSGSGENQTCETVNSGSMGVYHNNTPIGSGSGNGSATWQTQLNAALMSQGEHTFSVSATDSQNEFDTGSQTITIDNTPEVTIAANKKEGFMNPNGTVDFTENPEGAEGTLWIYLDPHNDNYGLQFMGTKSFEGSDSISWTWEELAGSQINTGVLANNVPYAVIADVKSANGLTKRVKDVFTVDNTPKSNFIGVRNFPDNTFDVFGTTTFKENPVPDGYEGSIALYYKDVQASSYTQYGPTRSFDEKNVSWKYSDFGGARFSTAALGGKELIFMAVATAANGSKETVEYKHLIKSLGNSCPEGP